MDFPSSSDVTNGDQAAALSPSKITEVDESPDTILGVPAVMRGENDVGMDPYLMTPRIPAPFFKKHGAGELNWMPDGPYTFKDGVATALPVRGGSWCPAGW